MNSLVVHTLKIFDTKIEVLVFSVFGTCKKKSFTYNLNKDWTIEIWKKKNNNTVLLLYNEYPAKSSFFTVHNEVAVR